VLAPYLARAYITSLRVTRVGPLPERGIIALWHEDLAVAMKAFAHQGIHVLLSTSRDGEIAARTAMALGYQVLRGSSSRQGASGVRQLVRAAQARMPHGPTLIGMALDGPRGPRRVVKPGTLWLAEALQIPVYPLGVGVKRGMRLQKSWDQARLPLPFIGRACAVLGRPCMDDSSSLIEGMSDAEHIAEQMIEQMADRLVGASS
jgi:lysophospholipid acyltransferase (LPLAT)-like uncharacterized protein